MNREVKRHGKRLAVSRMRSPPRAAWIGLGGLTLLLNCASPFLEKARDPTGLSGGLGVYGVGAILPGFEPSLSTTMVAFVPAASARYRFGGGMSLSLEGGGLYTPSSSIIPESLGGFGACAVAGAKLPVGRRGALKLDVGAFGAPPWTRNKFIPLVNLTYLHDIGDFFTLSTSIGTPMLVGLGMAVHVPLGRHVVAHLSTGTSTVLSAGVGLGVDVLGEEGN